MFKKLLFISFLFVFSLSSYGKRPSLKCPKKGKGKVVVCHSPPGNPENAQILSVGANALEAHLAHGDHEGLCSGTEYSEMQSLCGVCDVDVDPTCE